jgi:polyhydroxyalkanoate synthase
MARPEAAVQTTGILHEVQRSIRRARNGIGHVTGVRRARVGLSPKETVWQRDKVQLWRYHNPRITKSPPVLLVMSLVTRSFVLDLRPGNSYVERLCAAGYDTFMLDWGIPDAAESHNTLETYVDEYLPLAVDAARKESGRREVTIVGYCLGGVLALLFTAAHPVGRVRNLVLMATPIDYDAMGLIAGLVRTGRIDVDSIVDDTGNVPAEAIRRAFQLRRPTAEVVKVVGLWENLWNDEYVDAYQAMSQWLNEHIPFPGAAARELVSKLIRNNQLLKGSIVVGGRSVKLKAVKCPVLNVVAVRDDIVPIASASPALTLVGSADTEELRLEAGHVALVAGRTAAKVTIPRILDWIDRHSDSRRPAARFPAT